MNWRQIIPTAFTIAAMLAGFLSILVTIEGMRTDVDTIYRWSALLIMLAMILDGIDGNIARALKGQTDFGAELDTYVDLTAFGLAPAILIYAVTLTSKEPVWRIVLPSAVALSGVVRLARFKAKDPLRGQAGYAGLPITGNAGWVALFVFISQTPPRDNLSLNHGLVAALFLAGIATFIVLQVTNLRYPKPTKKAWMFVPCVILVALLFVPNERFSVVVAVTILCMGLAYGIFGPLFVKTVEVHKARRDAIRNGNGAGRVAGA